jgi:hypothetical protein
MNKYFVKAPAELSLQITHCSEPTRKALERQARRSGETVNEFLVNVILGMLESNEEYTPAEELEEATAS